MGTSEKGSPPLFEKEPSDRRIVRRTGHESGQHGSNMASKLPTDDSGPT